MKLQNFQYNISAQKDGAWYHIVISKDSETHTFMAHYPHAHWAVIVSRSISELIEDNRPGEAEELRKLFTAIFTVHKASIEKATKRTTETVKVYSSEA